MRVDRFALILIVGTTLGSAMIDNARSDEIVRAARGLRIEEWQVPSAQYVRDPAIDADGRIVFAMVRGDRLARFDPAALRFQEWKLPAGAAPHGVAIARDEMVFYGGYGNGTLGELDLATGVVREYRFSNPSSKPYAIVIDPKGSVWVTLRGVDRIARLDRASGKIVEFPMSGEPYGLVVDDLGRVWVSCISGDRLGILDTATGAVVSVETGKGSKPRRLALDRDGVLWVSLYGTGRLLKVDTRSMKVLRSYTVPGGENAGPYSVSIDASGKVWVSEFQTDTIAVFDPSSEQFRLVRLPMRDSGVRNATLDQRGRLWYISSKHGRIGVIE